MSTTITTMGGGTPTTTSAIPNNALKQNSETEKWEINSVGEFFLQLYHSKQLSPQNGWYTAKHVLREQFRQFLHAKGNEDLKNKFAALNYNVDFGRLLFRTRYLINTPRGSDLYRIKSSSLFQYRNYKLAILDEMGKNGASLEQLQRISTSIFANSAAAVSSDNDAVAKAVAVIAAASSVGVTGDESMDPALSPCFEVDDNAEIHPLKYEGTKMEARQPNFQPTSMGCYICQRNFSTTELYEQHVEEHGDESDFKFLSTMEKYNSPLMKLCYQLCKNSHYFCFTLETFLPNVIIEKIVIVQSCSFYNVPKARVPYTLPTSGKDTFFVDSHLFTKYVEQPIVVVFHPKQHGGQSIVEEHHFMRVEDFPVVNIDTRPWRLPTITTFKPKFALPQFNPPQEMCKALNASFPLEELLRISNEFSDYYNNEKRLTAHNLRQALSVLLQVEDMDTISQYRNLVQRHVTLRGFEREFFLKLAVPNTVRIEDTLSNYDEVLIVAEKSGDRSASSSFNDDEIMEMLLKNTDDLTARLSKRQNQRIMIGKIARVNGLQVTVVCERKISQDQAYMIVFRPGRLPLRYQYRALELFDTMSSEDINRFLFPQHVTPCSLPFPSLNLYNASISENPEQLQAVRNIAEGPQRDATYIIFGPPGTGKTTTIVEAILQLHLRRPYSKILVTAGSNSACDEIALRLCSTLDPKDNPRGVVRIYSRTNERRSDNIAELLLEASNMYSTHFFPDVGVLHEYRIVVCTLCMVGKLATGKFGKDELGNGIFTHVFIDEAAASNEAEALVGMMGILSTRSSLILSGDHKQLGPILKSQLAVDWGLGVSLLERLLARDCYRVDPITGNYNRSIQTRLCRNYRSHPEIVNLYSGMYYNNELMALASRDVACLCRDWHSLPNSDYPIIFHSIAGSCIRGGNSMSMYNPQELGVVMDYVKDLMYFGVNGQQIKQTDIGIISPYKKQYQHIQEELNLRDWYDIDTGSVELFQGKEKPIIIVSFVRSNTSTLGFLENPRRLNVTLSRPKSLLILIGNVKTLSKNADFKHIINECQRHKTLVGVGELATDKMMQLNKSVEQLNKNDSNIAANQNGNEVSEPAKKQYAKKKKTTAKQKQVASDNLNGNNKNQILQQNEQPLRQPMKKRVQPTSQEQQRKQFEMYAKLINADVQLTEEAVEAAAVDNSNSASASNHTVPTDAPSCAKKPINGTERTLIDELFDDLPSLPGQASQKSTSQPQHNGAVIDAKQQDIDALKALEMDIHESMRKLKITPPTGAAPKTATMTPVPVTPTAATDREGRQLYNYTNTQKQQQQQNTTNTAQFSSVFSTTAAAQQQRSPQQAATYAAQSSPYGATNAKSAATQPQQQAQQQQQLPRATNTVQNNSYLTTQRQTAGNFPQTPVFVAARNGRPAVNQPSTSMPHVHTPLRQLNYSVSTRRKSEIKTKSKCVIS